MDGARCHEVKSIHFRVVFCTVFVMEVKRDLYVIIGKMSSLWSAEVVTYYISVV